MGAAAPRPAGIEVRPVQPEEWAEAGRETRAGFAALFGETDREYLEMVADVAGRSGRTTVLVAVEDGRILGSVTVEIEEKVDPERELAPDEAHLRMLGVAPRAQRRGVGRALVEAAAAVARAAGKRRLTLGTLPEMIAAQRLYEAMGFQGGPPVEHAEGRSHLTYELPLLPLRPER
ncbi:MAG: GNAT family N-acetyltransferase [Candidatus Dormibacteria bacterium]